MKSATPVSVQRLLYVFPEPLPLQKARAIQVMHTLAALAEHPFEITLAYVPTPAGENPFTVYGLHQPDNVTLLPLSNRLPWPLHRMGVQSGQLFVRRLLAWIHQQQQKQLAPEMIMVRHIKLAARLLEADADLPLLYEAHEIFVAGASPAKAERLARMEALVLQKARGVITITKQLGILLSQRYQVQRGYTVIPSATQLPSSPIDKNWEQAKTRIIYAGSMYGWKGVDDLVAATAYLPADHEVHLIGGSEDNISKLRHAAPANGAKLVFHGYLSHQEVMQHLADACIAVLPNRAGSVSDFTSPLKLFEYMASGCAIVASDLPVLREILNREDASWCVAGNPEQLADAILKLTKAPESAARMASRTTLASSQYSWTGRAEKLAALIRKLVAGASS